MAFARLKSTHWMFVTSRWDVNLVLTCCPDGPPFKESQWNPHYWNLARTEFSLVHAVPL